MKEETVFKKLAEIYGDRRAPTVMEYLLDREEATDDQIAEDLGLRLGDVRKALYSLSSEAALSSRMESDPNTGWITYYWYVPRDQLNGLLRNIASQVLSRLRELLEEEEGSVYYWCGGTTPECDKLPFSESVDRLFRCPDCGESLNPYDNSSRVTALRWLIGKLERTLEGQS